jgi:hypothetical protein
VKTWGVSQCRAPYLVKDFGGDGQGGACVGHIHDPGDPALAGSARQQQVHLEVEAVDGVGISLAPFSLLTKNIQGFCHPCRTVAQPRAPVMTQIDWREHLSGYFFEILHRPR